jgi:hypothetical protein
MIHFDNNHRKAVPIGQALTPIVNYEIVYSQPRKKQKPSTRIPTASIPQMPGSDLDFIQSIIRNGGTPLAFANDLQTTEEPVMQPEPVEVHDQSESFYFKEIKQMSSKDILDVDDKDIKSYVKTTFKIKDEQLAVTVEKLFRCKKALKVMDNYLADNAIAHLAYCL